METTYWAGGHLFLRGLECCQYRCLVKRTDENFLVQHILPQCTPDQRDSLLTEAVRQQVWRTVLHVMRYGISDDRRRWVVKHAMQHVTTDDSHTSELLSHCTDDQLVDVFQEAVKRRLWRTVRELIQRPIDDDLVRQAIQESYRSVCGESLTDYTLPACRDDQYRDFLLTDAVRRGEWKEVGELLERGVHATLVRQAIQESYRSVSGESLTDYTLPACRDDQYRDFLLTDAVRRGEWKHVQRLLYCGVHDALHRWAIVEASQRANENTLMQFIPLCKVQLSDGDPVCQNMFVYERKVFTSGPVDNVSTFPQCTADASSTSEAEEETGQSCQEQNRPPHLTDDNIRCVVKKSVKRELWEFVGLFLQAADVDDKQKKWAVTQFTCKVSDKDFHKAVHYPDSHINVLFKEALRRRLWPTVKQLIQRPIDDDLVRQAIQKSYRSVCGKSLTDYTLPACRDDQYRDFLVTDAVRWCQWKEVGELLQCGVHGSLQRWAIVEASKQADENSLMQFIPLFKGQLSDGDPVCQNMFVYGRNVFTSGLVHDVSTFPQCTADASSTSEAEEETGQSCQEQNRPPHLTDDIIRCVLIESVKRELWEFVGLFLQAADVDDKQKKWAITQFTRNTSDEDFHKAVHYPDSHINVLFKEAVGRRLWPTVKQLIQRPIDDDLVRQAIEESYRSVCGESLTDYTLPACREYQYRDFLLTDTVRRGEWKEVGELLQRGVGVTLHRWAIVEASKHADENVLIQYILPHCVDGPHSDVSRLTQDTGNRRFVAEDDESPRKCFNPLPALTEDQQCIIIEHAIRRHLWKFLSRFLQNVKISDRAEEIWRRDMKEFSENCKSDWLVFDFVQHCPREHLLFLLTLAVKQNFTRTVREIGKYIDSGGTLTKVLCDWVKLFSAFPVQDESDNPKGSTVVNTQEDQTLMVVMTDIVFHLIYQPADVELTITAVSQPYRDLWTSRLLETYTCVRLTPRAEETMVSKVLWVFFKTQLEEHSNTLLVEILSTVPLLPSLQSVAVRLMLRDKRWDVISNAVLCRVWEDVRRSVLKAAVEQREWATVKHMADHSLYDDERNWALMEAFYQGRWSVVIALAEFGHDRDQLRRIYRQVAKHAHWDTVLEIFDRGADVQNVREELETANISRERLPRLAVLAGYEYRLLQLYMLEDQVESEAQNIEHAIQQKNWRAVLHKVRREASTFSLALNAAIEKEAWHVVVQLVRLGMDAAQRDSLFPEVVRRRQWGVGRALLECGFFDGGEHGVSVELRRAALPQLVNVGQWILVARVMEHGVDDEERRQVMWEALDRREGSVVAHIISIMEDRVTVEERERVFQQALSQGVWQALKRLVEFKDIYGITHRDVIIRSSAKYHQWDILTHCLRHGADIDKRDAEGDTMLHKAAREDDCEGVEGLLYHGGANQNLLDKDGYSVLHKAVKEPDEWWKTWRSRNINWDAIKMLVEFQCDINQPSPHGDTPLQRMIKDNQGEIIKCCTMWGRDVGQAATKWDRKTALHAVCEAGVLDTMHIIVARGGDPLAVTRDGETILLLAVRNRKYLHELLAECIKLGISTHQPRITDHWMEHGLPLYSLSLNRSLKDTDFSPLYYAVCHRYLPITEMLYESGSCSNRELYNIAQNWFDPANYTDSRKPPPSIRADQAAYVSMIVSSPRSLQSMCRLVISHHIGVYKPRRREQRVKQLPILSRKMKNYVLFSDLTDPELDKKRPQWSVSTDIPWWYKFDTDTDTV